MFEQDYLIKGKHATYAKFLKDEAKVFDRIIDVYMNGAIFGFLYGRKSEKDNESEDSVRIFAGAFSNERQNCDFIFRLIMLLDDTSGVSSEERIDRTFRDDAKKENSEKNDSNMNLFISYVLGGIEVLYEKFTENCTAKEDYIDRIFDIVKNFKEEIEENMSCEKKIGELINN